MERFQKSPEDLLSETLNDLMESYRGLKQNLNEYSQSVRNLNKTATQQKFPDSLHELKDQSISHFDELSTCYHDYSNLIETFQTFFETYRGDFQYWLSKESQLQRSSEDFKPTGDKIVDRIERAVNTFKKFVEQSMKAVSEAQDTLSIHQEVKEKSNRQVVSCSCVFLWLPRAAARGCGAITRNCRSSSKRKNLSKSSSHENLVLEKEKKSTVGSYSTSSINDAEKLLSKMDAMMSAATILINAMYTVSNGMSYVHQELCRLDYLDANKEKHFEMFSKNSDALIKVTSLVYSGLTIAQCESLKIVKAGYGGEKNEPENNDEDII